MSSNNIWLYIFCCTITPGEVLTGRTMDPSCSAQSPTGRDNKSLSEEQKTDFSPLFALKVWLRLRAIPWGLAHFSQTGNKGSVSWTGTRQWTSWPRGAPSYQPFSARLGNTPSLLRLQRSLRQEDGFGKSNKQESKCFAVVLQVEATGLSPIYRPCA